MQVGEVVRVVVKNHVQGQADKLGRLLFRLGRNFPCNGEVKVRDTRTFKDPERTELHLAVFFWPSPHSGQTAGSAVIDFHFRKPEKRKSTFDRIYERTVTEKKGNKNGVSDFSFLMEKGTVFQVADLPKETIFCAQRSETAMRVSSHGDPCHAIANFFIPARMCGDLDSERTSMQASARPFNLSFTRK